MSEAVVEVTDVRTFETKGGNTRYVVSNGGNGYTTFREQIGQAALGLKGARAWIAFHDARVEPTPPPRGRAEAHEDCGLRPGRARYLVYLVLVGRLSVSLSGTPSPTSF
jgi:hypothetical protein